MAKILVFQTSSPIRHLIEEIAREQVTETICTALVAARLRDSQTMRRQVLSALASTDVAIGDDLVTFKREL